MGENRPGPICKPFRTIPGCEHAYILATGPEIGHTLRPQGECIGYYLVDIASRSVPVRCR